MLKATVTGRIWSTKKLGEVPTGSILEVQVDDSSTKLLAFDPLGCGDGERVMVATGSVAAAWFPGKAPPIDALIVGSIDESSHAQIIEHQECHEAISTWRSRLVSIATCDRPKAIRVMRHYALNNVDRRKFGDVLTGTLPKSCCFSTIRCEYD